MEVFLNPDAWIALLTLTFLEIILGSSYEIETQLIIAFNLNFISELELTQASKELDEIIKMISKFKSSLKF